MTIFDLCCLLSLLLQTCTLQFIYVYRTIGPEASTAISSKISLSTQTETHKRADQRQVPVALDRSGVILHNIGKKNPDKEENIPQEKFFSC